MHTQRNKVRIVGRVVGRYIIIRRCANPQQPRDVAVWGRGLQQAVRSAVVSAGGDNESRGREPAAAGRGMLCFVPKLPVLRSTNPDFNNKLAPDLPRIVVLDCTP
jgi:hypothetical protein